MKSAFLMFLFLAVSCTAMLCISGDFTQSGQVGALVTKPSPRSHLVRAALVGAVFGSLSTAAYFLTRQFFPGKDMLRLFLITALGFTLVASLYYDGFRPVLREEGGKWQVVAVEPWGFTRFFLGSVGGIYFASITVVVASAYRTVRDEGRGDTPGMR
jgi:hypothetical protein